LKSSLRSLSFSLPTKNPIGVPLLPHACYTPCPHHPPWLDHSNYIWVENRCYGNSYVQGGWVFTVDLSCRLRCSYFNQSNWLV
jgi:hypothetical protein